jgi:hypothetical protein
MQSQSIHVYTGEKLHKTVIMELSLLLMLSICLYICSLVYWVALYSCDDALVLATVHQVKRHNISSDQVDKLVSIKLTLGYLD